jgi:ACS family tartrate transporter-like MFS transporter
LLSASTAASEGVLSSDADRRLIKRVSRRIIPFIIVLYFIAYLDRINISFAALQMNGDLKFISRIYGLVAGIFFVGYFLCEVPSNLILEKVGAKIWITRIMITWGLISTATAFVVGQNSFSYFVFCSVLPKPGSFLASSSI